MSRSESDRTREQYPEKSTRDTTAANERDTRAATTPETDNRERGLPPHDTRRGVGRDVVAARGGLSFGSVLTGVVVALGATALFSAIIAGVLAAINANNSISKGDLAHGGLGGAIGVVVALFIAYLWGGYSAGRMARGAGVGNGLLVPIVALILGAIVGAVVYGLGATFDFGNLNLPFNAASLTHRGDVRTWGVVLGIAALVAMLLGGLLGGGLGARWHTKLERDAVTDPDKRGVRTKRI